MTEKRKTTRVQLDPIPKSPTSKPLTHAESSAVTKDVSPTKSPLSLSKSRRIQGSPVSLLPHEASTVAMGLRKDVLSLQQFLDVWEGRNMLSCEMRDLESDLLSIDESILNAGTDTLAAVSATALIRLIHLLQEKVARIGKACGAPTTAARSNTVVGDLIEICVQAALSAQHLDIQETENGLLEVIPTDSPADQSLKESPMFRKAFLARKASVVQTICALAEQARRGSTRKASSKPNSAQETIRTSNTRNLQVEAFRPVSADSLRHLESMLGTALDPTTPLDFDCVIRKISDATRLLRNQQKQLEDRIHSLNEHNAQKQVQHRLEIEGLHRQADSKGHELEESKKNLSLSRFHQNQVKYTTTVHDAPMSFEAERQYIAEISKLRQQLDDRDVRYLKLMDSGKDDREKITHLTSEHITLLATIDGLQKEIISKTEEMGENNLVCQGLTRTRNEESRMSSTAVTQLEARVNSLKTQLQITTRQRDNLKVSCKRILVNMCDALEVQRNALASTQALKEEFSQYKKVYNVTSHKKQEELLEELLTVGKTADEREASTTLYKQQLEDAEVLLNLVELETNNVVDRLRSSTEWKMIIVRLPDEMKQLSARLNVLLQEKGKKEVGVSKQHRDRLESYRGKANAEVEARAARRLTSHPTPNASLVEQDLNATMQFTTKMKREGSNQKAEKRPARSTLADQYIELLAENPQIVFEEYYNELYPVDE